MKHASLSAIKWLPVIAVSATIAFMSSPVVAGAAGTQSASTSQATLTHMNGSPPFQRSVTHEQKLNNAGVVHLTLKGKPPFDRVQKTPHSHAENVVTTRTLKGSRPPFKRN